MSASGVGQMLGSAPKQHQTTTSDPVSCSPVKAGDLLLPPPGSPMNRAAYGLGIRVLAWLLGSPWP
jgi:hypothetical protein